jgi:eukaryotic-like serine/threonine-protein kinase
MWSNESGLGAGVALAGRYRLVERIGAGGFGAVFRAQDEDLGREVAVKVLRPTATDPAEAAELLARFDREAKLTAGVRHPNVVAVHDRGTHGEVAFVVMELLPGPDLGTVVRQRDPLPVTEVLAYGRQVAVGLAHLHGLARPVIHRDLKPPNLLLDGDVVKICDFGIAIAPGVTRHTQVGVRIGSPQYMSPEQCRGDDLTPASDVHAFGAVLYCLLAGGPPFSAAEGFVACAQRIIHDPPDPIQRFRPDVPDALADLVHAMLAKDPSDRPDAGTVAQELRAVAAPESRAVSAGTQRRAPAPDDPQAELVAAGELLARGGYAEAAVRFTGLARRLDADGRGQDPVRFAAEFGRVRAADALGRGSEAALRWGRLLARATAALGEDHDLVRELWRYGEVRSR